ncbi:hypothetical protein OAE79_02420 [Rhodopirellula sp.]|nr:hypothetical protein [Rhodopirellula sp.]MDB4679172.1 hypothetical protein [Rhodopirellula sp.]
MNLCNSALENGAKYQLKDRKRFTDNHLATYHDSKVTGSLESHVFGALCVVLFTGYHLRSLAS